MPTCRRSLGPITAVAALAILAGGPTRAADPKGRYENAKMKVTMELNPVGSERVALSGGTVKLKRRSVKATFIDLPNDRLVKLKMRLAQEVMDTTDQIVVVSGGEVSVKDLASGAPIASGGEFVKGRFRIRRKNDPDRTWIIEHDQRLEVREMSGVLTGLSKGTLKAKR